MPTLEGMLANSHLLLFDGDCGICTRSAEICARIDSRNLFRIAPYRAIPEEELAPYGLSHAECAGAVQIISSSGRVYSGPFAVNYFLFKFLPWSILIVLLYAIPIFLVLEILLYRLVAANRQRISRLLGLTACRVNQV
ncbi:MAG: DUF393 domain-containing protein [Acidobacteriota bacterium]